MLLRTAQMTTTVENHHIENFITELDLVESKLVEEN